VDFDVCGADDVRGRQWHVSQRLDPLPGGMLRLTMRLNSIEEAEMWVMGFGTHATVVRPNGLAERLRKTGEEFVKRYGEGGG